MGLFGPPNVKRLEAKGDAPGLISVLRHEKDADVRVAAAEALGRIGDPLAVEPLNAVVQDRYSPEPCRRAAVEALGKIGAFAVEPLSTALKDPSADIREAAAKELGAIGGPRAVESLGAALDDSSAGVRQSAAKALSTIGWTPDTGEAGAAYYWVEKRDWAQCVSLGAAAVNPLLVALKRRDRRVRQAAAETLGKIADPRSAKALVAALGDSDQRVRQAAAEALVKMLAPAAKPLAAALLDGNETRRRLAKEVLDRTGWSPDKSAAGASYWVAMGQWSKCVEIGAPAVKPLLWALEHEDEWGRAGAALALGKIGDPRAVEPLCACLRLGDVGVRQAAAEALGEIRDPSAIDALTQALGDLNTLAHDAAAEALRKIGASRPTSPS